MPSRRDQIEMTPEEIRAYLAASRRIILVTNGPNGMPHPVPMNYGVDADGRIVMTGYRKSQKVKNLERDPRAALLVESGATYQELRAVVAYCDAEIIDDPAQIRDCMRLVRADSEMADSIEQPMSEQVQASIAKRVILRFRPFRYVSWDHGKLGKFY